MLKTGPKQDPAKSVKLNAKKLKDRRKYREENRQMKDRHSQTHIVGSNEKDSEKCTAHGATGYTKE